MIEKNNSYDEGDRRL